MTRERLAFLIEDHFRTRRKARLPARFGDIARLLDVHPATLRRWLQGGVPIPRSVWIVMEVLHRCPDLPAEVERVLWQRYGVSSGQ